MSASCECAPAGAQFPPPAQARKNLYPAFREQMEPRQLCPRDSFDDDEILVYPLAATPPPKCRLHRGQVDQSQFRKMGEKARCKYQKQNNEYSSFGTLDQYIDCSSWNSVPALISYCIAEIETRSFIQCGIYSEPACKDAVIDIIRYFMELGPNGTLLMEYDMHVLANCIVHFLGNLAEPVVPLCMRDLFLNAVNKAGSACSNMIEIKGLVDQLPCASRDTLQRICPHLLTITKIRGSNQKVSDLAAIFGPIVFGVSGGDCGYDQAIEAMATMIQTIRFSC